MRPITTCLIALTAFALGDPTAFAAEQGAPYAGPWPDWHAHWSGFWWLVPLMFLLFFVFFVVMCFGLRRDRGGWWPPWRSMIEQAPEGYRSAPESALDILNKRYARGEIEKAEYEEKKAAIMSTDG